METTGNRTRRWISGIEPAAELLSASGTEILEIECREQPGKLRELIREFSGNTEIRSALRKLRESVQGKSGPVMFVGMGASYCSSISGSILLQTNGLPSFSVDAGEWLHYGAPVWKDAAASILLTTSGESAELVELFMRGNRETQALICNNPASTCWNLAETRLPILAGPEYGNATKTYTNAAAASIIAASEIAGISWQKDAEAATETFSSDLDRIFALRSRLEEFCRGAANTEIIGRGAAYGGAIMSALCIREMTGHRAAAHTGAGFRHGQNLFPQAGEIGGKNARGDQGAFHLQSPTGSNRAAASRPLIPFSNSLGTIGRLPSGCSSSTSSTPSRQATNMRSSWNQIAPGAPR